MARQRGPAPKYGESMQPPVSVRLPADLRAWLTSRADDDGRRLTDVLRELVEHAADADRELSRA
jgi:hypothetical protein